ncbi:TIGR02587 family membrane protein [Telluribacter sp.]|jgi:putative integral membrane protein (TIGR02587 family)|uniref:TIGR02587 family membrane protein n=1 Tax=Telluribacter sp. TaxID=1978767 RepID=UPI002E0D372D|nr:TIGR02587 family membrane protein [Telluribacter sp.]
MEKRQDSNRPISESQEEYGRGIAGGLLFSFPLLYTMEVWWSGFIARPFELILVILFTFLLLLGYNRYAGMHPEANWRSVVIDSFEEIGIGFLLAFGILLMLGRIDFKTMSLIEIVGKVVVEAMVVSIGVSIGTSQLGMSPEYEVNNGDKKKEIKQLEEERQHSLFGLLILGICGSIVVGGNVAPTEEILMIGIEAKPIQTLVMALVSLALCLLIIFYSDFRGGIKEGSKVAARILLLHSSLSYLIALGTSALVLSFFGRFDNTSFSVNVSQTIALGVLSSLGASAGSLLIR